MIISLVTFCVHKMYFSMCILKYQINPITMWVTSSSLVSRRRMRWFRPQRSLSEFITPQMKRSWLLPASWANRQTDRRTEENSNATKCQRKNSLSAINLCWMVCFSIGFRRSLVLILIQISCKFIVKSRKLVDAAGSQVQELQSQGAQD